MSFRRLRLDPRDGFIQVVGVGGIGTGTVFALHGDHTLGRNESRMAAVVDARDYCKLHIVEHYIAALFDLAHYPETCKVVAVGNVGADSAGSMLIREMEEVGIDTGYICVEVDCRTMSSVVFLYPDKSGGNITASNSATSRLSAAQLAQCRELLAEGGSRGIALCLPEAPLEKRAEFLHIASECGSYCVASFTSAEMESVRRLNLLANVDLLALNGEEAMQLAALESTIPGQNQVLTTCARVASASNPSITILASAGAEGVHVYQSGNWSEHRSICVDAVSTAGAGDALLAGVVAGRMAGLPLTASNPPSAMKSLSIDSAIDLGLALAAFSVTSPHTIHPEATLETLIAFAALHEVSLGQNVRRSVIT